MERRNIPDDDRWRDAMVGNALAPLPEPWFIKRARELRGTDGALDADATGITSHSDRDTDPMVLPIPAAPPDDRPVDALRRPHTKARRGAVIAGGAGLTLAGVAAAVWALQTDTRLPPVAPKAPVVASSGADAAGIATAALQCSRPETVDRIRALIVDRALAGGGQRMRLQQLAAGMSLGVSGRPSSADSQVSDCSGWVNLRLPGDRSEPLVAAIWYSALQPAAGNGRILSLRGVDPVVERLALGAIGAPAVLAEAPAVAPSAPRTVLLPVEPAPASPVATAAVAGQSRPVRVGNTIVRSPWVERPGRAAEAAVASPRTDPVPVEPPARSATVSSTQPSFDCREADSPADRLICGDSELAELDRTFATQQARAAARANSEDLRVIDAEHTRFLNRRERCRTEECMTRVYQQQIGDLADFTADEIQ